MQQKMRNGVNMKKESQIIGIDNKNDEENKIKKNNVT